MRKAKETELNYTLTGITQIGKARGVNQDNFYFDGKYREPGRNILGFEGALSDKEPFVIAVFDGMGGEKHGETASLLASRAAHKEYTGRAGRAGPDTIIRAVNTKLCREMEERKCRMGSTCVFLECRDDACRSWNIGDSRAYHFHEDHMDRMTRDHTEEALYAELFSDASVLGTSGPGRLTQYLGIPEDEFILEPYCSPWVTVSPGDLFLLCSDGLTHRVDDMEICGMLRRNIPLTEKREELLELALRYGETDDITIIIIGASCDG